MHISIFHTAGSLFYEVAQLYFNLCRMQLKCKLNTGGPGNFAQRTGFFEYSTANIGKQGSQMLFICKNGNYNSAIRKPIVCAPLVAEMGSHTAPKRFLRDHTTPFSTKVSKSHKVNHFCAVGAFRLRKWHFAPGLEMRRSQPFGLTRPAGTRKLNTASVRTLSGNLN